MSIERTFVSNRVAGDQVRVNIRTVVNASKIRRETRGGREHIIVPSATLPDNVVMNGILYPAEEIEKSFRGLERTPAPLGHPTLNGKFVSASDPEAINRHYIGAWNENVRREGGRVLLDKVIDVEVANQSERGRRVLAAIDAGGPIHTSTGLLARMEPATNAATHKKIARDYYFDHDAVLLDEDGAATPEQGVGMMVNAAGEEIEVINSSITDDAERDIDWAVDHIARSLAKREEARKLEPFKAAIIELGRKFLGRSEREPSQNQEKAMEAVSKEQFDGLSAKVDALSESLKPEAIGTAIANAVSAAMKPITDAHEATVNAQKAKDDAELDELRGKVVKANLMTEDEAKELTLNAARALAKTAEPGSAAALNSAFKPDGQAPAYKLPKGDK